MATQRRKHTRFRSKYPFRSLLRYIPKRYANLKDWQLNECAVVNNFKNGEYDDTLCQRFADKIRTVFEQHQDCWVITFIPPSIGYEIEYAWRYRKLADYLTQHLPEVPVIYGGVTVKDEWSWQPKSHGGQRTIVSENLHIEGEQFRNKAVILIDDVITSGSSFRAVGDTLMQSGATRIYGILLAMTIHPNLPIKGKGEKTPQGKVRKPSEKKVPTSTLPFPEVATSKTSDKSETDKNSKTL